MLVYLDSSAIVKLVRPEPETRELFDFLHVSQERVTSVVATIEVSRAIRRVAPSARTLERLESVLARIAFIEMDARVRARAATLEPTSVRTLDAVHLATALDLGDDLEDMVTYDERQAAAARDAGIVVVSPGR